MLINELAQQIEALSQRAIAFQTRSPAQHWEDAAVEELFCAIEELRVAEEELRQQNEALQISQTIIAAEKQRYQSLFDFAPDGYLVTDCDGKIAAANRAAALLLGVHQKFLVGKPLTTYIAPQARSSFRTKLAYLQRSDSLREWEVQLQPRHGSLRDAALTVSVVRDALGKPEHLRWLLRDISDRKQAARQLTALNVELMQRSQFEETLRRISEKVRASLDEQQVLQTAVQELAQVLRLVCCDTALYDLNAATSTVQCIHSAPNCVSPSRPGTLAMADCAEKYQQLLQGQQFQFCELTDDPVRQQVSILACPIADHSGVLGDIWCFSPRESALTPIEVHLVQQVASQCAIALRQARLFQAAQAQVAELAALNRLKTDFLSAVSHELRTPLTNMKMALHLLEVARSDEQRSRCLQILKSQCDREIELVTNLLDLQDLEGGSYPDYLPESIALQEWLLVITQPLQERMLARQQLFTLKVPASLPPLIADRSSLRRLLLELLLNAHKFTAAGDEIIFEAQHDPDIGTVLSIHNAASIPVPQLDRIFDTFYRVPQPDPWQAGGTGLGLALAKQLVERMQGSIAVKSENGWTSFTVTLPKLPFLRGARSGRAR